MHFINGVTFMCEQKVIFTMYDNQTHTWNVMQKTGDKNTDSTCIHYGDISSLVKWLEDNRGTYIEIPN